MQLSTSDGKNTGKFIGVYTIGVMVSGNKKDQDNLPFKIRLQFFNEEGNRVGLATYTCGEKGTLKLHYRNSVLAQEAKAVNNGKAVAYVTNPKLLKMLQDGICFEVGLINKLKPLTIRPDADF